MAQGNGSWNLISTRLVATFPSDLVDRGGKTIVFDLNSKPLPDLSHLNLDVAVFAGVLEYISDLDSVVHWLSYQVGLCIASYRCAYTRPRTRWTFAVDKRYLIAAILSSRFFPVSSLGFLPSRRTILRRCLRLQAVEFGNGNVRVRANRSLCPALEEPPPKAQPEVVAFKREQLLAQLHNALFRWPQVSPRLEALPTQCLGKFRHPVRKGGLQVRLDIPDTRRLVITRGDDARAVRAEAGRINSALMTQWLAHRLAGFDVPDTRRLVITRGDNARAVWAKARRINPALMAQRFAYRLPVFVSQIRAVWSADAVTMRPPSALKLASLTWP